MVWQKIEKHDLDYFPELHRRLQIVSYDKAEQKILKLEKLLQ